MNPENEHPSKKTLFAFAQGKLAADSLEQVAEHVEKCATCVDFLEQSINDTLVDQLREAAVENATDLFEESFEVNQTIQFSTSGPPVYIESVLSEHPKYNLQEQIGAGGMGAVYKARHEIMDREVAIKVIRPEFVSNTEAVARFHTEVRAAAKLSHRNIVAAYDAEQVGNAHFLIMEFVIGESLAETVARRGPLPITHACNYAVQVAQGLKHAHENGMIHRDIKPQNLMKTPKGIIKILDFGLARIGNVEQEDEQLTSTGVMMGTADYISPEQARNAREADIRSDLYSLGCTLYFLLAGRPPFKDSKNRVDKILAHCTNALPDLTLVCKDLPAEVWQIIQKLTAKSADDRFQSPGELIDALTPFAKPARQDSNTIVEATGDELVEVPTLIANSPAPLVHAPPNYTTQSNANLAAPDSAQPKPQPFIKTVTPQTNHPSPPRTKKLQLSTKVGMAVGAVLLLVFLFMLPGLLNRNDSGKGTSQKSGNNENQNNKSKSPNGQNSQSNLVVALFAYQRFCFGDFGPFRDELEAEGLIVATASHPKRTIEYVEFAEDQTPNKHNVAVDFSIEELRQKVEAGEVAAIVIMGGDSLVEDLADESTETGRDFAAIYQSMASQKKWIGAIGKGINLPYQKGFYDNLSIADPESWLDVQKRSNVNHMTSRIQLLSTERIITAKEWHDSSELGKTLANALISNRD